MFAALTGVGAKEGVAGWAKQLATMYARWRKYTSATRVANHAPRRYSRVSTCARSRYAPQSSIEDAAFGD